MQLGKTPVLGARLQGPRSSLRPVSFRKVEPQLLLWDPCGGSDGRRSSDGGLEGALSAPVLLIYHLLLPLFAAGWVRVTWVSRHVALLASLLRLSTFVC